MLKCNKIATTYMRKQGVLKDPDWYPVSKDLRTGWFLTRLTAAPITGCLQTLECVRSPLWTPNDPAGLKLKGTEPEAGRKHSSGCFVQ